VYNSLTALQHNSNTPLHHAANEGHKEILVMLLDRGAAIEAQNEVQSSPQIIISSIPSDIVNFYVFD
jgi:ankyrin repeat protein